MSHISMRHVPHMNASCPTYVQPIVFQALREAEERCAALSSETGAVQRDAALLIGERDMLASAMRKQLSSLEAEVTLPLLICGMTQ